MSNYDRNSWAAWKYVWNTILSRSAILLCIVQTEKVLLLDDNHFHQEIKINLKFYQQSPGGATDALRDVRAKENKISKLVIFTIAGWRSRRMVSWTVARWCQPRYKTPSSERKLSESFRRSAWRSHWMARAKSWRRGSLCRCYSTHDRVRCWMATVGRCRKTF